MKPLSDKLSIKQADSKPLKNLIAIAEQFKPENEKIKFIEEYGNGNVNDTYLVTVDSPANDRFILQRINTHVFHQPELLMRNMRIVSEHAENKLSDSMLEPGRRWQLPRVLLTRSGSDHKIAGDGSFWRALSFIDGACSFDTVQDETHANEVGYALGTFHNIISDLPPEKLADTLKGFHITPHYLQRYDEVTAGRTASKSLELDYCSAFIDRRRSCALILEKAKAEGKLRLRPIHGDPKMSNVMIDATSGQAVSIVDLDTVKPGLVHYDIGDCLRSSCNPMGEDVEEWQKIHFDLEFCSAILKGYLSMASKFLTDHDYHYLYDAIRLIAFELGLRFFTDYLEGNIYFKAKHSEHNLLRALIQFKLTESIEKQATAIRALIQSLR